jgi:hypothetical protein
MDLKEINCPDIDWIIPDHYRKDNKQALVNPVINLYTPL